MNSAPLPEPDRLTGTEHPRFTKIIYGQRVAEERFLNAFCSQRLLHAWLLTGPKGVGKATLAWRITKFLMMQAAKTQPDPAPVNLDVDPNHLVIRRILALSEPGLSLVRRSIDPRGKHLRRQITVEDIRLLGEQFALAPPDGLPLIAIVDAADDMNNFAANALLKLLEEPPANTFFFLVSHSPNLLLPTIRSRCGVLRCSSLNADMLKLAVEAATGLEIKDQAALFELTGGSVGDAVQLHANRGLEIYCRLVKLLAMKPNLSGLKATQLADECTGRNADTHYETVTTSLLVLLARLTKVASGIHVNEAVSGEAACLTRLAQCRSGKFWSNLHTRLSRDIGHAREVNLDPASVVLDMLFKIDQTAA